MFKKAILASCVFLLAVLVYGCGQTSPNLNINSNLQQQSGIKLRGTVYEYKSIFFFRGSPVPGATVTIRAGDNNYSTITNSKGEYSFSGIPDGRYAAEVTSEGHAMLTWWVGASTPVKNMNYVSANNTVTTWDILVFSFPIITRFSPDSTSNF